MDIRVINPKKVERSFTGTKSSQILFLFFRPYCKVSKYRAFVCSGQGRPLWDDVKFYLVVGGKHVVSLLTNYKVVLLIYCLQSVLNSKGEELE